MNKIKLELRNREKAISFNEEKHVYHDGEQKYISVTQLIRQYTPEFDADGSITKRCAEKAGITEEEQRQLWEDNMNQAAQKGTDMHTYCEELTWNIPNQHPQPEQIRATLTEFYDNTNPIATEQIVYSKEHGVAGTMDLLSLNTGQGLNVDDYKTNKKKITPHDVYGETMLPPLSHLANNNYYKYALQLSIYRYLLELWGYTVDLIRIIHIRPRSTEFITLPYLRDEAEMILTLNQKGKRGF